jgi:biopolymer transport protein ExbB
MAALHRRASLSLAAALLLAPGLASAWWNSEWTARTRLQIDASGTGANVTAPVGGTAVLLRLHLGNFRFDAANESGSDLRFIAADDQTPLAHHVEKYDALLGEALVWVRIPDLKPGAKTELWLYHGNPKATPTEDVKGTYDPSTVLVYHFTEQGQPARDSSTWGNQAASAATTVDGGLIGRALRLDGATPVSIPPSPSLSWAAGAPFSWSAWVKPADASASGIVFSRRGTAGAFVVGVEGGKPFVEVNAGDGPRRAAASVDVSGGWHHLAVAAGQGVALYVDGLPAATLEAHLPALDAPFTIGAGEAAAAGAPRGAHGKGQPASALPGFKGDLDELELAKVERPAGFFQVAALSQGADPGKFVVFGQDEETGGGHTGYFAILIGAVTLDGWVVIGLLAVMSLVSWLVMATKASYLRAVERSNGRFAERFAELSEDLVRLIDSEAASGIGEGIVARDSSLFRIFHIATAEVRKRTRSRKVLTAEAIEAVRASMDAGLVRENQRLTKRMVILTIAIAGGPFLGLLGTVVGVMITFAAIAAAGDVNVNSIAPGIAAALVATVAGLGVAIPALFGYNWLLTRIKEVTAVMQVFADELVAKLAEAYAAGGARDPLAARLAQALASDSTDAADGHRRERPSHGAIASAE